MDISKGEVLVISDQICLSICGYFKQRSFFLIKYAFTSMDISNREVLFISDQICLCICGYFKGRSVIYI